MRRRGIIVVDQEAPESLQLYPVPYIDGDLVVLLVEDDEAVPKIGRPDSSLELLA